MTELVNTWQRFAEVTIQTNDLDPMYSVIHGLNQVKDRSWMGRFIMYFVLFYDAGGAKVAADSTNDENFWEYVRTAAYLSGTKRGTERRHFRAKNALNALDNLEGKKLAPWPMLLDMYEPPIGTYRADMVHPNYSMFSKKMSTAYAGTQMGPYFIWKLYDIFNVCLDRPITLSLDEAVKYMPDEPRKAVGHFFPDMPFINALSMVTNYIGRFDHPVVPGRKCSFAEAETVLCMMKGAFKTKSHVIGDDIEDKYKQLVGHQELIELLPDPVHQDAYKLGDLSV